MSTTPVTPNIPPPDGSNAAPPGAPPATTPSPAAPAPAQPQSRLGAILGAVAKTVDTGLAGVPAGGRPSFMGGLGQGARAEKQDIANQQAVKFKTFDDQVRAAELHNQDQKMQLDTQAQTDAHTKADLDNRAMANSLGVDYDTIANHGSAVMDHLAAQTTANGTSSIPGGTHLSGDGTTVQIPKDTQQTRDGQKAMYNQLAPALGLPSLPPGASFVPPKNMNMLTNKIHGFDINGEPIKHDDLPTYISTTQTQRDALSKNGASDDQLKTLDNMVGIYKANLDSLDKHAASVKQSDAQATTAGTIAGQTSPEAIAAEGKKAAGVKQAQLDVENNPSNQAAAARGAATKASAEQEAKTASGTSLMVGTDKDGNQIAGTSDELTKAGAQGVTKLSADTGNKVVTARQLTSPEGLFAMIRNDMDTLDQKGKMGSAASARFNDALLTKAGSDPDYAPLITHTHLLATALMQAHVGSKGSENMMEEFKNLANAGKMSASTLRSALGAEYNYVHEKAMLPKKAAE